MITPMMKSLSFKQEADSWSLPLSAGLLEVGRGSSLCFVPAPPPVPSVPAAPPVVAPRATHRQDRLLLHYLGVCEGGQSLVSKL